MCNDSANDQNPPFVLGWRQAYLYRLSNDRSFSLCRTHSCRALCLSSQTLVTHIHLHHYFQTLEANDAVLVGYHHHAWGLRGAGWRSIHFPLWCSLTEIVPPHTRDSVCKDSVSRRYVRLKFLVSARCKVAQKIKARTQVPGTQSQCTMHGLNVRHLQSRIELKTLTT